MVWGNGKGARKGRFRMLMTSRRTCGTNTRTRECDFKDQNMGTLWLSLTRNKLLNWKMNLFSCRFVFSIQYTIDQFAMFMKYYLILKIIFYYIKIHSLAAHACFIQPSLTRYSLGPSRYLTCSPVSLSLSSPPFIHSTNSVHLDIYKYIFVRVLIPHSHSLLLGVVPRYSVRNVSQGLHRDPI